MENASFDIEKLKKKVLRKYPAFGSIIVNCKYELVDNSNIVNTAGTDGKTIYLNKDYLRKLEEDEQVFVLSHEICHIGLNHILRSKDKDPRLWNIATDAVINRHLVKDGLPKVDNIVYKEDALNYDAEELYNKLLKEKQDKEQQGNQGKDQQQSNQDSQNGQPQSNQGQGQNSRNEDSSSNRQKQGDNNSQQEHNSKNDDNNSQYNNFEGKNQTNVSQQQQSNHDSQNGQGQNGNNSQNTGEQNKNSQSNNSSQGDSQVGHDEHTMWENAVKEYEKEQTQHSLNNDYKGKNSLIDKVKDKFKKQSENNGKEQESKKEKDTNESNKNGEKQNQNFDSNKKQDSQNLGKDGIQQYASEKEFFKKNEEMKIKYAEEVMSKLSSESRGFGAGGQLATFKDIGKANKAVLNWKKVLKQTLEKEDEAWGHRFSDKGNNYAARIEDVEYDEMPETEIILDVSGSVSEDLLRNFLRQVKTILKESQIKVGTFSNDFHGFQVVKKDEDIDKLVFKIGGGTNFNAASKAFTKRKDVNKICFTDGQDGGDAGIVDKRKDIIWITFENANFKPDNGKVIYVPKSELMLTHKNAQINFEK